MMLLSCDGATAFTPPTSQHCQGTATNPAFYMRDCAFKDLPKVCNLVMESFFSNDADIVNSNMSSRQDCYRNELSKLETAFPQDNRGDGSSHRMLVAAMSDDESDISDDRIIGFVHLDNRSPSPDACLKYCPRPIVTDLMVCKSMRRKGIACQLMQLCQQIALNEYKTSAMIYLRVVESNIEARRFYAEIGFAYCSAMKEESRPELLMFQKLLAQQS